jgi:AraC-like DNA-binding protein/mannose-6-phosphate isomerase-like protein (cupin superfamily)
MATACLHFKLAGFVGRGERYHFTQSEITATNGARYHDHDYHEIFWVERGRGRHVLNGEALALGPGQLFLIHPDDRHSVSGDDEHPLGIVNVAFPSQTWRKLRMRYFANEQDPFNLPAGRRRWPVEARLHEALVHWRERLTAPARPQLAIDGFLMDLPERLRNTDVGGSVSIVPDWLSHARVEISKPGNFSGGTRSFARLAGRSPAHVARETVRCLGVTPTDLVNSARMDFAARQLSTTPRPILEVMLDCGLNNLSHFYALFRDRFGVSPRRYRLQAHSTVLG